MLLRHSDKFQRFFQENLRPIWSPNRDYSDGTDLDKYGKFDVNAFSELELRMYMLIKNRLASKTELETVYTLDEALKLYALMKMEQDIESAQAEEMKRGIKER